MLMLGLLALLLGRRAEMFKGLPYMRVLLLQRLSMLLLDGQQISQIRRLLPGDCMGLDFFLQALFGFTL